MIMRQFVAAFFLLFVIGNNSCAFAMEDFTVSDIRVEGLQRISAGTVFNYIPVEVEDKVDEDRAADIIRSLFKTGFFKDVWVESEGSTLVIFVVERPSIASITFHGNSDIDTEILLESLRQIGFSEGQVFDRSIFDRVEQELRRSYFSLGKYGVEIERVMTPLERNRVAVQFNISEGEIAKIKQINIVGNQIFTDDELLDLFELTTSHWYSFITKSDQYSKQKLSADLESIRSYYLDHGYVNFSVDSTQVSVTPDKRHVYITVNVNEGDQFTVSSIKLAGDFVISEEDLFKGVSISEGFVFARAAITETTNNLTEKLGDHGYAFANVNAIPNIQEDERKVNLTFFVDPGKRVYVRRINFEGNTKTSDEVLRREMRQLEGAWISTKDVKKSQARLERLGFFEEVNIETPAVPGTTDQVDINVSVVERPSGNIMAGAGYSQSQGILLQGSVSQENFLGTGNRLSVVVNTSEVNSVLSFSYLNPYYTVDGVSRGFHARYREVDTTEDNISEYKLDEVSAGLNFGIPINELDSVNLGFSLEKMDFHVGDSSSPEVIEFENEVDGSFHNFLLTGNWSRDSRNRKIFPDSGAFSYAGAEATIPGGDLEFYKLNAKHQQFFPIYKDYVLMVRGEVGVGDGYGNTDHLPLIENFFAGGIGSVRGFESNTLGPHDSSSDPEPLGGDLKLEGSAEIIIPVPFVKDIKSTRLSGFFDVGNVYGTKENFDTGTLRYSAGLATTWLSPFGALTFSYALLVDSEPDDDLQRFQFSVGSNF